MTALLRPSETEIDEMVNRFYGIEAKEEAEAEEVEEEVVIEEDRGIDEPEEND